MNDLSRLRDYVTLMAMRHSAFNVEVNQRSALLERQAEIESWNAPHLLTQVTLVIDEAERLKCNRPATVSMVDRDAREKLEADLHHLVEEFRAEKNYAVSDRIRKLIAT